MHELGSIYSLTETQKTLQWLEWLTTKQVIWVQSKVKFIQLDENYEKKLE